MNVEEIRAIFNKIDVNGDGHISKEEFILAAQQNDLGSNPEDINAFMKKIDTDGDGKITFEEFNYFVQFNKSHLNEFRFLLDITSRSIGIAKQIEKVIDVENLNKDQPSKALIILRDEDAKSIELTQSSIQVHVGDFDSNAHVAQILKQKLDANAVIGLKFHVQDKEMIKNNFKEYIQALKEFLAELGPEASQILDAINIQLHDVEDGVLLTVDPASHPFITSYVEILKKNFEQLQNLKSAFSLMVGVGQNLGNKSLTYEQLIDSNFFFELSGRAIKLANLAQTPALKANLQALNANKDSKGALLAALCLLSFKGINAELLLNSNDRKQFIEQAEIQNLNSPVWESHFDTAKNQLAESGLGDFLDSLDFVKQAINDLNKASCSAISVFVKVHDVYVVVKVKADLYPALNELFGLEG